MSRSLVVVLQQRIGARRGGAVLAFIIAWDTARRALGPDWPAEEGLTAEVEAYTKWWNQSVRTSWREVERFREALPAHRSPSQLLDELEDTRWNRRRGALGLGAAVLPA